MSQSCKNIFRGFGPIRKRVRKWRPSPKLYRRLQKPFRRVYVGFRPPRDGITVQQNLLKSIPTRISRSTGHRVYDYPRVTAPTYDHIRTIGIPWKKTSLDQYFQHRIKKARHFNNKASNIRANRQISFYKDSSAKKPNLTSDIFRSQMFGRPITFMRNAYRTQDTQLGKQHYGFKFY